MKIVYVFRSLAIWGGIERIIIDKANRLASLGYHVTILTADQGAHPVPYSVDPAVHVEDLGVGLHRRYRYKGLRRLWVGWRLQRLLAVRLRRRLGELRPDAVVAVATDYVDFVVSAVGGRAAVIVESHSICRRTFGQRRFPLRCYHDWRRSRSLAAAHTIVALTEADAADWRRSYPRVVCIPNIVSLNPTSRMGSHATRRVIFVGRFDGQKRPELAISIWRRVQPRHPGWELHVYGDGERREAVAAEAARTAGVVVHQPTPHIFDAYCDSAFLVLTSLYEPFGLVIAEAMSCGLPAVAFDCPYGPRAIITDGADGFLVGEGDEQGFADRMERLMDDGSLCSAMGTQAARSSRRYAASRVMPQWQQLFDSCLNG